MRLIDADATNKKLFYKQMGGKDSLITAETAFSMLEAQPTAYDVDKVVEQLKEVEAHCLDMYDWQGQSAVEEAIEIVKAGGIDANN